MTAQPLGGHPNYARRTVLTTSIMIAHVFCKVCREVDGVLVNAVVNHRCLNHRTGKRFTALVCANCLEAGRVTRVTCRTFARVQPKETA